MKTVLENSLQENCKLSATNLLKWLQPLNNKNIFVTGGTGFVGKWIAEAIVYLNTNHQANINLYLQSRDVESFRNTVPHLASKTYINLIEGDVKNIIEFPANTSHIIHAAATPDRREHATQPLRVIDTIYKGTVAVLSASLRLNDISKIVFLSSNHIYGNLSNDEPVTEHASGYLDSNAVSATYAEAKRLAETVCAIYRNQQKLPVCTVRPFAFIGPYQDLEKPWAINNFMRDALLGGPIRVIGDAQTVRSYLYGSDMAFWLLAILASPKPAATYNLGSEEGITMKDLSEKIINHFPNKISIDYKSLENKPQHSKSVPNIAALKKDIPAQQQISLQAAIRYTLEWYKENNHII